MCLDAYEMRNEACPILIWTCSSKFHLFIIQDHSIGNEDFIRKYPELKVYGGDDRIPGMNHKVEDGEVFKVGDISIKAIYTPGHTTGSFSFYLTDNEETAVFTGIYIYRRIICIQQ